jgi:glyoxalase family protein
MGQVLGIHHVTAIAGDPQRNLDFYAGVLGLRLVKRTVNFDDPHSYHLYYGDATGSPGSLMTFFPWPGARRGRAGAGQAAVAALAVRPGALGFWDERLRRHGVHHDGPRRRGRGADAEEVLAFDDPDGLRLELVAHPGAEGRPAWDGAPGVSAEHAVHGLHGVTLWVDATARTERVLADVLGFRYVHEDGATWRYAAGDGGPGTLVDLKPVGTSTPGVGGAGTIHHVAFTVADDAAELAVRARAAEARLHPTPVIDRQYFRSVYFREPGGALFELATRPPGFAVDEPPDHLGERLVLPPRYERDRAAIEAVLPRLHLAGSAAPQPADSPARPVTGRKT